MLSGWIFMPLTAAAASTPCSRVSQLQPWAGRLETSESFDMSAGKSLQGYTWSLPNGSISAWIRLASMSLLTIFFTILTSIDITVCVTCMVLHRSNWQLFFQQRLPDMYFKSWIKPRKSCTFLAKSASNPSKTWRFLEFSQKIDQCNVFLVGFWMVPKRAKIWGKTYAIITYF